MKAITVVKNSLPEAWEEAVIKCWEEGEPLQTEYDKSGDPNSKDVYATIHVLSPMAEPRIHLAMPAGLNDLEKYRSEVLYGVHDHWIKPEEGKWEYCVHPSTKVLMADYSEKIIAECTVGDNILSMNVGTGKLEISKICQVATSRAKIYNIELQNGLKISTSSIHPLYILGKGWVKTCNLNTSDKVACAFDLNYENHQKRYDILSQTLVSESDIRTIPGINHDEIITILRSKNLLPFDPASESGEIIVSLCGYLFGDGWLETPFSKNSSKYLACRIGFAGEYSALRKIKGMLGKIGFSSGDIKCLRHKCKIHGRNVKGQSLSFNCGHSALWALMRCLGCPIGDKPTQDYTIPKWVMSSGDLSLVKCFLDGFIDAEFSAPYKSFDGVGYGCQIYFRQNKRKFLKDSLIRLVDDFWSLFIKFGVNFSKCAILTDNESYSYGLRISGSENIDGFLNNFNYIYSYSKEYKAGIYKKYRDYCYETLINEGVGNLSNAELDSFGQFKMDSINGNMFFSEIAHMSVDSTESILYDVAVDHKDHNFIGNGIVCHNTYHQRLFKYECLCPDCKGKQWVDPQLGCHKCGGKGTIVVDQISKCVEMLKECGFTRRAQAVTWQAWNDLGIGDPTCLQRMWFRIQNGKLNMVAGMRSNDAFKAAFMNMYAFTELQQTVAMALGVEIGEYIHVADSFHIYGSYFDEFGRFYNNIKDARNSKTYNTSDAIPYFIDGCDELLSESDIPRNMAAIIRARKNYLSLVMPTA